jgi:hypothetical protein
MYTPHYTPAVSLFGPGFPGESERVMMFESNGKIKSTMFGVEDHGILTFMVYLEGNGWAQGVGGYGLDNPDKGEGYRPGFGLGLSAMRKIMETVGIDQWEKLPGTLIRIRRHDGEFGNDPPVIGHIIEDRWFDLRHFMESRRGEQ